MPQTKKEETIRGRIRSEAMMQAANIYGHRFDIDKIRTRCGFGKGNQRRTIQRTLREMVAQGWLEHEDGSPYYRAGPRLETMVQRTERRPDWPPDKE